MLARGIAADEEPESVPLSSDELLDELNVDRAYALRGSRSPAEGSLDSVSLADVGKVSRRRTPVRDAEEALPEPESDAELEPEPEPVLDELPDSLALASELFELSLDTFGEGI